MTFFLDQQPAADRDAIAALLKRDAVQMSVLLYMDFADEPLALCNRAVPFTDNKWGRTWGAGGGLLVGLPDIGGGDGQLAPFREYALGVPSDIVASDTWAADLVAEVGNVANYRRREIGLYGQIFDPDTNAPVGHPFAYDVGVMDKMTASFSRVGAIVSMTSESFLSRKGVPVYGMQTYFDQKRRYPTDEGLQFTTEANKLVVWTDW